MDRRAERRVCDRHVFVHEVTRDIKNSSEHLLSDRHGNGLPEVREFHSALQTVRGGHRHRTHPAITEVLLDFKYELGIHAIEDVLDFKGVINFRQRGCLGEIRVDDGADDLDDGSGVAHEKKY